MNNMFPIDYKWGCIEWQEAPAAHSCNSCLNLIGGKSNLKFKHVTVSIILSRTCQLTTLKLILVNSQSQWIHNLLRKTYLDNTWMETLYFIQVTGVR